MFDLSPAALVSPGFPFYVQAPRLFLYQGPPGHDALMVNPEALRPAVERLWGQAHGAWSPTIQSWGLSLHIHNSPEEIRACAVFWVLRRPKDAHMHLQSLGTCSPEVVFPRRGFIQTAEGQWPTPYLLGHMLGTGGVAPEYRSEALDSFQWTMLASNPAYRDWVFDLIPSYAWTVHKVFPQIAAWKGPAGPAGSTGPVGPTGS